MAITFDGPNKLILLSAGTASLSVQTLWSEWVRWHATSDNGKFLTAMRLLGGEDIDPSAGSSIPFYVYLQNGWRIRPQESNHTLDVTNGVLLVEGGGDPFVDTLGGFTVRIRYSQPIQAINVGAAISSSVMAQIASGVRTELTPELAAITAMAANPGLTTAQANMLLEMYELLGLDPTKPLLVTANNRTAGSINQVIVTDASQTLVTRV
jgi:hypothetical protein